MSAGPSVEDVLGHGLPVVVEAEGGSMWPLVRAGDRLRIQPDRVPRVGDLVAYRRRGRLVVHRAARVGREGVTPRGDLAGSDEPCVSLPDVLGVVTVQRFRVGVSIDHASPVVHAFDHAAALLQPVARHPVGWLRVVADAVRSRVPSRFTGP